MIFEYRSDRNNHWCRVQVERLNTGMEVAAAQFPLVTIQGKITRLCVLSSL